MEISAESKDQSAQIEKMVAIGQLAAGVAHEINSPMQFLGDNLSYLATTFEFLNQHIENLNAYVNGDSQDSELKGKLAEEWRTVQDRDMLEQINEAISDSRDGVEQVSRIVAAMKAFAHPGGADKTSVNLNQVVKTALTLSRNEWKYVAQIEQDLDEHLPLVLGDEGDLNQVFLNLIVNAAHAIEEKNKDTPCRGQIKIFTSQDEVFVRGIVEDTGCGIPAATREKIFSPNFTTKKLGEGTGLGLAIAHSVITQKHDGQIRFESREGQGTRFIVELPINGKPGGDDLEIASELETSILSRG